LKLSLKKYHKIIKLADQYKFDKFDLVTNYGLFSGERNLYKTLKVFEFLKSTFLIRGDIIEFGIFRGNNSLLIKKILEIYKVKKKLFLLDHFKGLENFDKSDGKGSKRYAGSYKGSKKEINSFIKFFKLKNIKIIDQDATKLKKGFFGKTRFSFAYFDLDLFQPTIKSLEILDASMNKGGLILFDEGNWKTWGVRNAISKFLKANKKYKKIILKKYYQPDIVLKKIKA